MTIPGIIITIIVIMIILNISAIVWCFIARSNLIHCESNESPICPSFYCPDIDGGKPGTKCATATDGTKSAWRMDGDKVQCQVPTLPPNVIPKASTS